ncbi:hypothetical protein FBULB1_7069 [Fusarium bulbicola]|nr:hypothetical protein FBULB1_7069 [Fusarium bulbicola]
MSTIPDKIRNAIELPGSYSLNQLLIDFGTPEILNIAWDHCSTPGVPEAQKATSRAETRMFHSTDLESVFLKENDHNILGFTVKIDAPSDGKTPELQTISYRPDGKEVQVGAEKSDHTAFLFTEMTQFREMPNKDLQWSGDWFYDGIGGTLAMSRGIFLEQYLAEKLQPAIAGPWKMANHIGNTCTEFSNYILKFQFKGGEGWILKRPQDASLKTKRGTGVQITYNDMDENSAQWDDGKHGSVKYGAAKEHYWYGKAELSCRRAVVKSEVGSSDLQLVCKIQLSTTIELRAIKTDAKLLVSVESKKPIVDVDIVKDTIKADGTGEAAEEWEKWIQKVAEDRKKWPLKKQIESFIEIYGLRVGSMAHNLEESLNQQGRFIFLGGGTFDMKDPIPSKEGVLLIGLTFREGE